MQITHHSALSYGTFNIFDKNLVWFEPFPLCSHSSGTSLSLQYNFTAAVTVIRIQLGYTISWHDYTITALCIFGISARPREVPSSVPLVLWAVLRDQLVLLVPRQPPPPAERVAERGARAGAGAGGGARPAAAAEDEVEDGEARDAETQEYQRQQQGQHGPGHGGDTDTEWW